MATQRNLAAAFPATIPLFPLSGVVMVPFSHLPLNVFEKRYIALVDDALKSHRLIGIVQPKVDCPDPIGDQAPLYNVGTVGRIFSFTDPGEGVYRIVLQGLARFYIENAQLGERGYRTARVDYAPYYSDLNAEPGIDGPGREQLIDLMQALMTQTETAVDWGAVNEATYHALIASLVMSSPFSSGEKQALLESTDPRQRARLLMQIIHMALETPGAVNPPGAVRH